MTIGDGESRPVFLQSFHQGVYGKTSKNRTKWVFRPKMASQTLTHKTFPNNVQGDPNNCGIVARPVFAKAALIADVGSSCNQ